MYRVIGDRVGTIEARDLAEQLVAWHDAMVKHLRTLTLRGASCEDGCPHDGARSLWAEAVACFGEHAQTLSFLRRHGRLPGRPMHAAPAELHP